jgi:glycosyltransferase involved in cell wall biosynthesis
LKLTENIPMKVLWFTDHVLPDLATALGKTSSPQCGWMPALAAALVESNRVELGIATNVPGADWRNRKIKGLHYYTVPMVKRRFPLVGLPETLIRDFQRVAEDFQPDVIHVHGTEYFHGLLTARGYIQCPTVVSIQGIIDACHRVYFGGIPICELAASRTLRDWIRGDGVFEQKLRWKRRSKMEREIFSLNSTFVGRTLWDKAHLRRLNPGATYYHCDELFREPFYRAHWNIGRIRRHSIFASSASYPLKGFHVLVKAVSLLRPEFPDISIRTPLANFYPALSGLKRFWKNCRSGGYAKYLSDLISAEKLEKQVTALAPLDAADVVKELLTAHAFVLPSLVENSPNSLGEAMIVGTPCVASYVGGVPSLAQDGNSALLFPPGDEAVLAEHLRAIFRNDALACRLSEQARNESWERHSKTKIVNDMIEIYKHVSALSSPVSTSVSAEDCRPQNWFAECSQVESLQ